MANRYNTAAFGAAFMLYGLFQLGALDEGFVHFLMGENLITASFMICAMAYAVWHTLHYQLLVPWLDKRKRKGIQHPRK